MAHTNADEYSDDSVLGVAVNATDIAIFKSTIQDSENFLNRPSAEEIENSVMLHEVGHLLGLVNCVYQSDISTTKTPSIQNILTMRIQLCIGL